MIDRDKVIKGLECCITDCTRISLCEDCPYADVGEGTCDSYDALHSDALALLKAQDPKAVKRWKTSERRPYCPNDSCGRPLNGEWQKYCEYCGQAVKWE